MEDYIECTPCCSVFLGGEYQGVLLGRVYVQYRGSSIYKPEPGHMAILGQVSREDGQFCTDAGV